MATSFRAFPQVKPLIEQQWKRCEESDQYYDIWCLLEHEHTSMAVAVPTRIPELAQDVLAHSTLAGIASRPRPADGYQNSEAFDSSNENLAETRAAFHEQVANLIWPDSRFPDFDEICTFVRDCETSL